MKRFIQIVAFFIITVLFVPGVFAADYWSSPLSSWSVSFNFGDYLSGWGYHLGQDVKKDALTQVKNARWGYVRHVAKHTSYGYVVIIESPREYETSTDPSKWSHPYCQVYGHLRYDSYLAKTIAKVGTTIDRGTVIGRLGSKDENGGWTPHLHYGIRKGRYSSNWIYYGYSTSKSTLDSWLKPSTVINNY